MNTKDLYCIINKGDIDELRNVNLSNPSSYKCCGGILCENVKEDDLENHISCVDYVLEHGVKICEQMLWEAVQNRHYDCVLNILTKQEEKWLETIKMVENYSIDYALDNLDKKMYKLLVNNGCYDCSSLRRILESPEFDEDWVRIFLQSSNKKKIRWAIECLDKDTSKYGLIEDYLLQN